MAADRIWNVGPPPHVGWWNASTAYNYDRWAWWNGTYWSAQCSDSVSPAAAGYFAGIRFTDGADTFRWTTYWPENARVPRVDDKGNLSPYQPWPASKNVACPDRFKWARPMSFSSIMEGVDIPAVVHKAMFQSMVNKALAEGYVVTAHTVPQAPLGMGNYRIQVEVRKLRGSEP